MWMFFCDFFLCFPIPFFLLLCFPIPLPVCVFAFVFLSFFFSSPSLFSNPHSADYLLTIIIKFPNFPHPCQKPLPPPLPKMPNLEKRNPSFPNLSSPPLTSERGVCVGDFHLVPNGSRALLQSQTGLQLRRHGQLVTDLLDVARVQVARQWTDVGARLPVVTWGTDLCQFSPHPDRRFSLLAALAGEGPPTPQTPYFCDPETRDNSSLSVLASPCPQALCLLAVLAGEEPQSYFCNPKTWGDGSLPSILASPCQ